MNEVLNSVESFVGGLSLGHIGFAFIIITATLVCRKIFDTYVKRGLKKIVSKTKSHYDDMLLEAIEKPISAMILLVGGYLTTLALKLPNEPYDFDAFFSVAFNIAISIVVIWAFFRLSNVLSKVMMKMFSKMDEEMASNFAPLITQAVKVTIVGVGILVVFQNLGYSIGSILAGLGIGGLAVALAAQDTLANLFGTLVMVVDKPFKVGDWVKFRDIDGNVETIGFRSTKVRTWSKSLKILPNKLLTSEIIENWSEMPKRRVSMKIGITYQSPPEKVIELRDRMEKILLNDPGIDQDYLFVYFHDFAPSSLELFVYYFTRTTVWKEYLEIRQRVNIKFMKVVEELGLSFAYPSSTIYFGDSLSVEADDSKHSGDPFTS